MATLLDTLVFLCQLAAIAFLAWGGSLSIREALAGLAAHLAQPEGDDRVREAAQAERPDLLGLGQG